MKRYGEDKIISVTEAMDAETHSMVKVQGTIVKITKRRVRDFDPSVELVVEDGENSLGIFVEPERYGKYWQFIGKKEAVVVEGRLYRDDYGANVFCERLSPVRNSAQEKVQV